MSFYRYSDAIHSYPEFYTTLTPGVFRAMSTIDTSGGMINMPGEGFKNTTFRFVTPSYPAPRNLIGNFHQGSNYITWELPMTPPDESSILTNYRIYRNNILYAEISSATAAFADHSIEPGVEYSYKVRAVYNNSFTSAFSNPVFIEVGGEIPAPVVNLTAVHTETSNSVELNWQAGEIILYDSFESYQLSDMWQNTAFSESMYNGWQIFTEETMDGQQALASFSLNSAGDIINPGSFLISPAVAVTPETYLYYSVSNLDGLASSERYYLLISTATNNQEDFSEILDIDVLDFDGWQRRAYDLSAYAGQTIYFGLIHNSPEANRGILLDGLQVLKATDISSADGFNIYRNDEQIASVSGNEYSFTDTEPLSAVNEYTVRAVYNNKESAIGNIASIVVTSETDDVVAIAKDCLLGNYPNPFNPKTNISFKLKKQTRVRLDIFNLKGQKIKTLTDQILAQGTHHASWDGTDFNNKEVSSGIYFYQLKTKNNTDRKKMLLLK